MTWTLFLPIGKLFGVIIDEKLKDDVQNFLGQVGTIKKACDKTIDLDYHMLDEDDEETDVLETGDGFAQRDPEEGLTNLERKGLH